MRTHFKRVLLGGAFLIAVLAVIVPAAELAWFAQTPLKIDAKPETEGKPFELRKGETPGEIAKNLHQQGAISNSKHFLWIGKLLGRWKKVKAGEYLIHPGLTPIQIFDILASGISISHPVTIREGSNLYEVADAIAAKKLAKREQIIVLAKDPTFISSLKIDGNPPTLEGYLFPDTYFFNRAMSPEEMLRQMVRHFRELWIPEYDQLAAQAGLTRHQIITLASIIEKETGAPQERPLIGSVFFNRLRKKMRLQSDPTTIYGIWERYSGNLRRSDLQEKTPYNTYAIDGLPPGPISNPGKEAILAALQPAQSEFLYFVSHNDGTHQFSRTLQEHNRAVREFQVNAKAREGKSWRDLGKRKE
jgi:UPF0755 protein